MSYLPGGGAKLLGSKTYDPATKVQKATTASTVLTALDTTNLRLTFTAPASGKVLVRIGVCQTLDALSTTLQVVLGILDGSTVKARQQYAAITESQQWVGKTVEFVIGGLTPGTSYTWDAAYGVERQASSSQIEYGGPNNTTANSAAGALTFEIWEVKT